MEALFDSNSPKPTISSVEPKEKVTPKKLEEPVYDTNAKLSFAMENRALSNKKVSVTNDENREVTGIVVGLDIPFVLVKIQDGPLIKVPRSKVQVI